MRTHITVASCLLTVLLIVTPAARADGLVYQLPADGSWVLYNMQVANQQGDAELKLEGTLRVSSVGAVTENDQPCRWIEFHMVIRNNDQQREVIAKVLVPERHLGAGQDATANRVRGWVQMPRANEPAALDDSNLGPIPVMLAGPSDDAQPLAAAVVESKLGKLNCAGVAGTISYVESGRPNKVTFETRRHEQAPFGVVSSDWIIEVERDGELRPMGTLKLQLADFGQNAASKLPDRK